MTLEIILTIGLQTDETFKHPNCLLSFSWGLPRQQVAAFVRGRDR
jgi:hypothetical protein